MYAVILVILISHQTTFAIIVGVPADDRALFSESCIQVCFYAITWTTVCIAIVQEPWFWTPSLICVESTKNPQDPMR